MSRYWAIIKDNKIDNIAIWDGEANWSPPADCDLVEITNEELVPGIGWTYENNIFVAPPPPPEPEPAPTIPAGEAGPTVI